MFNYQRVIRIQDTDSTGVIYFSDLQKIALEAFEEFLRVHHFNLHHMITEKEFLLPIVHAEADYKGAVFLSDVLDVELSLERVGTSSITLTSIIKSERSQAIVGQVKIVHVVMSREKRESMPIPEELHKILRLLLH